MRPYQIVGGRADPAADRDRRPTTSSSASLAAGGYVWHTTGSGKTLTSFKAAQLASELPYVDKVLFVVDRKDLDYQTMREYDRFEKGAANCEQVDRGAQAAAGGPERADHHHDDPEAHPVRRAEQGPPDLRRPCRADLRRVPPQPVRRHAHRDHEGIQPYHLFGFTGTPIFAENAGTGGNPNLRTTEQAFGERLHTYTIVDAINDKNVLPFRIDYVNTIKAPTTSTTSRSPRSTPSGRFLAPERIDQVVGLHPRPLRPEDRRAARRTPLGDKRVAGFNSLLATASIDAAKRYYTEFSRADKREARDPASQRLKIGADLQLRRERGRARTASSARRSSRPAPSTPAPATSWRTRSGLQRHVRHELRHLSSDKFQNYYKDLSLRLKNRELDLVIVVNMFLTGFDATTLNTLWVDKNLRQHGLIQAYSRTNRILNSVKTYGNIVSFRDLERGDQRRPGALRQQGRPRDRPAQAVRPTTTASTRSRSPSSSSSSHSETPDRRRDRAEGVHRALRRRSSDCATS